jgi:hypothetical protein
MKLFYIQSRAFNRALQAAINWFAAVGRGDGLACFAALPARVENMSADHAD